MTNWNIDENGDLEKNKNKFYNNIGLKKLPKNDKHHKDEKSLEKVVSNGNDFSVGLNDTSLDARNNSMDADASQASDNENGSHNEIKKKKKKKKNKNKDKKAE